MPPDDGSHTGTLLRRQAVQPAVPVALVVNLAELVDAGVRDGDANIGARRVQGRRVQHPVADMRAASELICSGVKPGSPKVAQARA